jgi:hypothetical protein
MRLACLLLFCAVYFGTNFPFRCSATQHLDPKAAETASLPQIESVHGIMLNTRYYNIATIVPP